MCSPNKKRSLSGGTINSRILCNSLKKDAAISWWQISGDGGQGKSRLALELVQKAEELGWDAGFLLSAELENTDWYKVSLTRPTLCVVDYVAAPQKAISVARGYSVLAKRVSDAHPNWEEPIAQPFRLLIIERAPFNTDGSALDALWYSLFCEHADQSVALPTLHNSHEPVGLTDLSPEDIVKLVFSWLSLIHI